MSAGIARARPAGGQRTRRRAIDPRLARWIGPARPALGGAVAAGTASAALLVAQAALLAHGIADRTTAVLVPLAAVVLVRAVIAGCAEVLAQSAANAVTRPIRRAVVGHALSLGPRGLSGERSGEITALASTGIDGLEPYVGRYVPQVALATIVPIGIVGVLAATDPISAATVAVTLPLIPLFMAIVGATTGAAARRRLDALGRLAHHFLDVVSGLATLKAFGRAESQEERVAAVGEEYRRATMGTLRLSFLSSLVLDLTATIAVALVAVGVGLRLADGRLDLRTGLFALILAPEAYAPLRTLGAHFHAGATGTAALDAIGRLLSTPSPVGPQDPRNCSALAASEAHDHSNCSALGGSPAQDHSNCSALGGFEPHDHSNCSAVAGSDGQEHDRRSDAVVTVEAVSVVQDGRGAIAPDGVTFTANPGEFVVLTGENGAGKSTLLGVLLGFVAPTRGTVHDGGTRYAYVPQEPYLFTGTVGANIALARPDADRDAIRAAAAGAALDLDLDRAVADGGTDLSAGQRRRVAVARALLRDAPVLLLDEPTAGLDEATERDVLRGLRATGRTVIAVSHRPSTITAADREIRVHRTLVIDDASIAGDISGTDRSSTVTGSSTVTVPAQTVPTGDRVDGGSGGHDTTDRGFINGDAVDHRAFTQGPGDELPTSAATKRRGMTRAVIAGGLAGVSAVGLTGTAAWLIATAALRPAMSVLTIAIVAVRAFGVGRGVLRYAERLAGHDAMLHRLATVRSGLVRALARIAPAGLPELRHGDLVARFVTDVDTTADRVLRIRLPYLAAALVAVLALGGTILISPLAAAGLAVSVILAAVIAPALAWMAAARGEAATAAAQGAYAGSVTSCLHGAADVLAFDATDEVLDRIDTLAHDGSRAAVRAAVGQGVAIALAAAAAGFASWWALRVGMSATEGAGERHLSTAALAVLALAPMALHDVLAPLAPAAARLPRFRAAAARIAAVTSRPDPAPDPPTAATFRPVPSTVQPPPPATPAFPAGTPTASALDGPPDHHAPTAGNSLRGVTRASGYAYGLVVDGLSVGWPGRDVLADLSFRVAAGGRVAIVGRSGAGKSTLAAALVAFLRPSAGTIRIGGTDLGTLPGADIRRLVGLCAQDSYVFDSSVAENVRLARPGADDRDVAVALNSAGLGGWLAGLPDGLHTAVGEHGTRLSGGQRQRLALARVLLADRPVVVLDEPVEHLDAASAARIVADLLDRTEGRTVVLLTHGRHGLDLVDDVVDLDKAASISANKTRRFSADQPRS